MGYGNHTSKRRFIRFTEPSALRQRGHMDPAIIIDRQRLRDVINSLESLSGE
mgnify:CR=1 FL=1